MTGEAAAAISPAPKRTLCRSEIHMAGLYKSLIPFGPILAQF